jgi:hypothetical protein
MLRLQGFIMLQKSQCCSFMWHVACDHPSFAHEPARVAAWCRTVTCACFPDVTMMQGAHGACKAIPMITLSCLCRVLVCDSTVLVCMRAIVRKSSTQFRARPPASCQQRPQAPADSRRHHSKPVCVAFCCSSAAIVRSAPRLTPNTINAHRPDLHVRPAGMAILRRSLGSTGLKVSVIGFGASPLGGVFEARAVSSALTREHEPECMCLCFERPLCLMHPPVLFTGHCAR